MSVTATVQATCAVSTTPLAFGIYTGATVDATATISVTCTNGTAWYVNLDSGQHIDAFNHPQMLGPNGDLLSYNPYKDSARTAYWGNTYNSDGVGGTGTGAVQTLTVYGRLSSNRYRSPGSYTDTITVTVTY